MNDFKVFRKILIFLFMGGITIPSILLSLGVEFQASENRTLSAKPEFSLQTICSYPDAFTSYYEDNMPFKNFFVKCNAFINTKLFKVSPEEAVILGKDGWLFYNSKYKENTDTLEDYLNHELISQEELDACKDSLLAMQQTCENNGAQFIFVVAPNKMTIYGDQFMPDAYERENEITKVDVLIDYLKKNTELKIVYPKNELLEHKDDIQLYYKLDSHWNELGGYIGYRELYEAMFEERLPEIEKISCTGEGIHTGDLAKMLKIENMDDISYNVEYKADINVERCRVENGFYSASDNQRGDKLLMFRDSYTTAMEKYITKDFTEAHLNWSSTFDVNLVVEEHPDIVIFEIVERSVFNIPTIGHIFTIVSETDEYNKENVPRYSSEEIIGYCLIEQIQNKLDVYGFSFIVGSDSEKTEASIVLVGTDISYEMPLKLEYRSDVAETYNSSVEIGYSGINVNLDLNDVKEGNYNVYITLKNGEKNYYHNLDYIVKIVE